MPLKKDGRRKKEVWKDIKGYEGYYQVSNFGRVKSVDRVVKDGKRMLKGRVLKPNCVKKGYLLTHLSKKGVVKTYLIHRLVLEAFVGICPEGMQCRHFPDRDKTNNKLSNISWGTPEENQFDRVYHETSNRGERQWQAKLTVEDVVEIRRLWNKGGVTLAWLGKKYKVTSGTISSVVLRKSWGHVQ